MSSCEGCNIWKLICSLRIGPLLFFYLQGIQCVSNITSYNPNPNYQLLGSQFQGRNPLIRAKRDHDDTVTKARKESNHTTTVTWEAVHLFLHLHFSWYAVCAVCQFVSYILSHSLYSTQLCAHSFRNLARAIMHGYCLSHPTWAALPRSHSLLLSLLR